MTPPELDDEMKGIFDRADELTRDLYTEYEACAKRGVVTERAKNLFHEVLVKYRSSLDMVMCRIYRRYSSLQGTKRAKTQRLAGFPIFDSDAAFRKKLNSLGLSHLETDKPDLYEKLRRPQPYLTKSTFYPVLKELSNLGKHVNLPKQDVTRRPAKKFTAPDGKTMIVPDGVRFSNASGVERAEPWPNGKVEDVIWADFDAYTEDGVRVFPDPEVMCLSLRINLRRYVQEILALI